MTVSPRDRLLALQRAGYRCEAVTNGRECPRATHRAILHDGRVTAVCLTHKHILVNGAPEHWS